MFSNMHAVDYSYSSDPKKHWDSFETLVQAIEDMKREISRLQLLNKYVTLQNVFFLFFVFVIDLNFLLLS